MPELPTSPNQPRKPRKELTMEMRLVIAFVLMGIVLFVSPLFFRQPEPPPQKPTIPTRTTPAPTPEEAKKPEAEKPQTPQEAAKPAPEFIGPPSPERKETVETKLYTVQLSNRGGVVKSWVLKQQKDSEGKPLELVNQAALDKLPAPFAIMNPDGKDAELNNATFSTNRTEDRDSITVAFNYASGAIRCSKTFRFRRDSYLSNVTSEVRNDDKPQPHLLEWRGGFGDFKVLNRQTVEQSVYFDLNNNKLVVHTPSEVTETGNYSFAGLQDTYFAALLLPETKESIQVRTKKDDVVPRKDAAAEPFVGVAVSGGERNDFSVFVGPKYVDTLNSVDPRLTQLIDWGWFWFLAKPLFYSLHWFNDHVVHNYGWSIVAVTIVINILLLPLRFKSMRSAKKMQALQPEIKAINAKYKDVGMRDPRKAEQNQEVMELYKKHGVNPMGGCLPMLIQLPILYAFFKVLNVTVELRGASWLWVSDLSQPEQLPIHILPIVMIITQFMIQKMTPTPGTDASQAKMMRLMPLIFGFFFYNMSSGLVLYWLTGNLVGIVQQWLMNKRATAVEVIPAPKTGPAKKKR